ncbi:hypothetical protein HMPREF1633_01570 [Tissierellia bacterium S5-A11]|nr:hypothetical protein HMPREF1633_01570 [Tissierellia bacterium S5-A11]
MTEEEQIKQTMEFMKKLNSEPMTEAEKREIEMLEAVESGEYAKTPESIKARAEIRKRLTF